MSSVVDAFKAEERTGGRPHEYEDELETLFSDKSGWPSHGSPSEPLVEKKNIPAQKISVDTVARLLLEIIDSMFTRDPRKSDLDKELLLLLKRRLEAHRPEQAKFAINDKNDMESETEGFYERNEPPEITAAFMSAIKALPAATESRMVVYTDEEMDIF